MSPDLASVADEAGLLAETSKELARHRVECGLVAVYVISVTVPGARQAEVGPIRDEATARLVRTLRPSDTVARLDDGTLAVLADGLLTAPAVFALNDRLLSTLRFSVATADDRRLASHVCIGAALTGNPLRSAADLLRHARLAKHAAAREGGNRVVLADPAFAGLLDPVGVIRLDVEVPIAPP